MLDEIREDFYSLFFANATVAFAKKIMNTKLAFEKIACILDKYQFINNRDIVFENYFDDHQKLFDETFANTEIMKFIENKKVNIPNDEVNLDNWLFYILIKYSLRFEVSLTRVLEKMNYFTTNTDLWLIRHEESEENFFDFINDCFKETKTNLEKMCDKYNVSISKLSKITGISYRTLNRVINHKQDIDDMSFTDLKKLSELFSCSFYDLSDKYITFDSLLSIDHKQH